VETVVFAIPVAADDVVQAGNTFARWKEQGYSTAALVDHEQYVDHCDHLMHVDQYKGWGWAVNLRCLGFPDAEWIVTGGADILPDPNHTAGDIAAICTAHFNGTFGVMQPSGDPYGALAPDVKVLAATSPWLGRDWRRRINGGRGPLWEGYWHFWGDGELAAVAKRLDAFWLNPAITQYHDHWARRGGNEPAHLERAKQMNSADRKLYNTRLAEGFPGHEPLPT
jgi:hypothetical protein